MSNLLTLSQDEITRFELKDKQAGDVITAEEYSALVAKAEKSEDKEEEKAKKAK
jgi:hypothetical protein